MVSRINLHENDKSELHCMIIDKERNEATPIMCHPTKDMVFILLSGGMKIEFYDDNVNLIESKIFYPRNPNGWYPTNPLVNICLIKKKQYYKMIPLTNVEYVEVNKGPFNKKTHNRYLK